MKINRDRYLTKLISRAWNGQVKVITGIGRCGKSYLLNVLYRDYLISNGVTDDCIVAIGLDLKKDIKYRNPLELVDYIDGIAADRQKKYYVFIDEIQMSDVVDNPYNVDGKKITFYDALNDLRQRKNVDVYVTGSNSRMLSTDILTEFRGRGDEIRVHPLSFSEFVSVRNDDKNEAFEEFCLHGGMPFIAGMDEADKKEEYLKNLFSEVYIRDVIERKKIKRPDVLGMVIDVLCSSIGAPTNPNKIANTINTKYDSDVTQTLVYRYMECIEDCFLFAKSKRYDIKRKSYFDYPSKYYCEDIGLRNARLGFRLQEITHIMENIVFNELKIRGFSIDVGVVTYVKKNRNGKCVTSSKEIDFIATKGGKKYYIQSAYVLDDETKKESETKQFLMVNDSFPKIIVRKDVGKRWYDDDGVLNVNITDFLLDESILS